MAGRVYEIMDWGAVESIVYSEEKDPHSILGPHLTEDGLLIQAFLPRAKKVSVVLADTSYGMEEMDEAGFFAALLPLYEVPGYRFEVVYEEDAFDALARVVAKFLGVRVRKQTQTGELQRSLLRNTVLFGD